MDVNSMIPMVFRTISWPKRKRSSIELLISSYFNIVKRTVIDTVPKAIMLNLVNNAKEELQRELLQELYKTEVLDELLKESEFTQNRRKECKKMIEALQKADEIVGSGKFFYAFWIQSSDTRRCGSWVRAHVF